ncbi:STAS domain-containing protein [Streptomyces qinzhouensis]|uniref:STAS domain-containing protein n=1 Tax=Streptomyces qinzhouensis TaxID=2599401 RepID=A0A5B8JEJ9_9ACTN|nr:STAS domain-containing protein [Streptomyces qinzhouensis]QDY78664.1 STAS domain-containing protein [Streptomyces qinzhouensis]
MCPGTSTTTTSGDTGDPVIVRISGRVLPADVPRLCAELSAKLGDGTAGEAVCDVRELTGADLITVDAVARLHLTARRLGCRLSLRDTPAELLALLHLVGLADLATHSGPGPGAF